MGEECRAHKDMLVEMANLRQFGNVSMLFPDLHSESSFEILFRRNEILPRKQKMSWPPCSRSRGNNEVRN